MPQGGADRPRGTRPHPPLTRTTIPLRAFIFEPSPPPTSCLVVGVVLPAISFVGVDSSKRSENGNTP